MKSTMVRHAVALILAILVLIASGVHYRQRNTDQKELYGMGLSPSQMKEASARLTEVGVAFQMNPTGDGLLVGAEDRGQALLRLSERGLPRVDPKWRAPLHHFDRQERRDQEIIRDLRELAGDIDGLEDLACQIVASDQGFFVDPYKTPACAAVMLALKPGQSISDAQLNALRHFLTFSAAPELEARWVKFYDRDGRELAGVPASPETMNDEDARRARSLGEAAQKTLRTSLATNTTVEVHFGLDESSARVVRMTVLGLKAWQREEAFRVLRRLLPDEPTQEFQLECPLDVDDKTMQALKLKLGHLTSRRTSQSSLLGQSPLVGQVLSLVSLLVLMWAGVSILRGHKVEARN